MNLQELLGDSYTEGMTIEQINSALRTKKLVDLNQGGYVDKNKYNTDINKLNASLHEKDVALQNKLTDDEKKQEAEQAKDQRIQELENLVKQQEIENNKNKSIATISEAKTILEIKDGDNEYDEFLNSIASTGSEDANTIAQYFAKAVKNAYQKGKNDATKDKLGEMGKVKGNASSGKEGEENLGTKLAKMSMVTPTTSYFGKMK